MHPSRFVLIGLLLTLGLLAVPRWPAAAASIAGHVIGVSDGDTITLLVGGRDQVRVRLSDIDTPETGQPWGQRSRADLAGLVFDRDVVVVVTDTDRYGRSVGRVWLGPLDVNAEMVRIGSAWVFRRYSHDPGLLLLEASARLGRRGLWSLPETDRIPPWEWREAARKSETGVAPAGPGSTRP